MTVPTLSDRISRLDGPDPAPPADIAALVERHHHESWIRVLARNPETARRFTAYFENLFDPSRGRLPLAERELIAVVVSATNGCGLCEIHHTAGLASATNDPVRARRLALDHHLVALTEREHAIVDFATKITKEPKHVGARELKALRDAGLSEEDILETVEISSWFNHTNRIFISLGVIPDEKFFSH
jgi:uncharacterized peroxidase-related enzyme